MIRALRPAACLSLILAAACGPKPRPATLHEMTQNDGAVCFKNALPGNPGLHGDATLGMYVDADGAIPAVWFRDGAEIGSPTFFRCMTSFAVESKQEPLNVDHTFYLGVSCSEGGCSLTPLGKLPPAPFDQSLAQATLTFSDWATATDKGWGNYYAKKYSDAQASFEAALAAKGDDVRALRGLAQTLVETNGDLKRARELAEKAVSTHKSAASLETLSRVCLKTGDDDCAVKNFIEATKAEDVKNRTFDLAPLNDPVKEANTRLESNEKQQAEAQAKAVAAAKADHDARLAKEDPLGCYKMTGGDQAKCTVKRCFGAGAETYARDLTKASKTSYTVGEMTVAPAGSGFTVTIPIRTAAKKKDTYQDGTWTVLLGDNFSLKAASSTAAVISKDHNACK